MDQDRKRLEGSLEPHMFALWLLSHSDDSVVGVACQSADCPLARYLRDRGVQEPRVGTTHASYVAPTSQGARLGDVPVRDEVELPDWARRFVELIDARHDFGAPVRCAEAIATMVDAWVRAPVGR